MRFPRWFELRLRRRSSFGRGSRRLAFPRLEALEDRLTPSTLIPVSNHSDLVFDPVRDVLYITTTAGLIQRWDVAGQQLLSPWAVGNTLAGADITPDDSSLYVAEESSSGGHGFFDQVALDSGSVTSVPYSLATKESGSWDIAIAANGKALVSSFGSASPLPLRQLDTTTNTYNNRSDAPGSGGGGLISQGTTIDRSADRSLFLITEANNTNGPFFLYNAHTNTFSSPGASYINLKGTSPVVNRNVAENSVQLFFPHLTLSAK